MKKKFLFILFLTISAVSANEIDHRWNEYLSKELVVKCLEDSRLCEEICGDEYLCVIPERPCRNCMGATPQMTYIFSEMGKMIVAEEEISDYELIDLIKSQNFISISSKSIYNQYSALDAPELKARFQSLCPESEGSNPIVFFGLNPTSLRLEEAKMVTCTSEGKIVVKKMSHQGDFDINNVSPHFLY